MKKVLTRDLVLHILLKYPKKIPIKQIAQHLEHSFDRKRSRTRIEQIVNDLERHGIVIKEEGVKDKRHVLCSINPDRIETGFFAIIKDLDSNPVAIYDEEGTISDIRFKYRMKHDLADESIELFDQLKILRDSLCRYPPAIDNKMRGFSDWGPDSQKLIEDLENALYVCTNINYALKVRNPYTYKNRKFNVP